MPHSYPYSATINDQPKLLEFDDGFKIPIEADAFSNRVDIKIDVAEEHTVGDLEPVTKAYVFVDVQGVDNPPVPAETTMVEVPHFSKSPATDEFIVCFNDQGYPHPEEWVPDTDIDVVVGSHGKLVFELPKFQTFQIVRK